MKKLIIAAAIVCAAVAAQAASVQWSVNATTADAGRTVYLLTSIAESYTSVSDFASKAVGSGSVVKSGPSKYMVKTVTSDNSAITSSANFYLAVVDTDGSKVRYVDVTSAMQGYVYEPPASAPGVYGATTFATISGSSNTANIPEPTSAMLLVLGVAGLALRRKAK